ncbi:hypothetical protein BJX96DRAFT_57677 [Aspergillus floccosus]
MILRADDLGARDGLRKGGYLAFFVSLFFCCNAETWFLFHFVTLLALPENFALSNCFGVLDVVFCFRCIHLFFLRGALTIHSDAVHDLHVDMSIYGVVFGYFISTLWVEACPINRFIFYSQLSGCLTSLIYG